MSWQYTPYLIPLSLSAIVSTILAVYAWRQRPVAGAAPLTIFMLAAAEWSMAYALELGGIGLETKIFWAKMQYFGIVTVAWMMLVMVLEYAGYGKWVANLRTAILGIIPAITVLLVWTNDAHHLIWTNIELVDFDNFSVLDLGHGPGFWIIIAYSYLSLVVGMGVLIQAYRRSPPVYRAQVGIMLAGTFAPWIGNALYVTGLNPFPHLDLTPFAFTLTGLAGTWGLFRLQLLDVVPIARDAVIEGMQDGVLVLDRQDRIVDINPTGSKMLQLTEIDVTGVPVEEALSPWAELVARYKDMSQIHDEFPLYEDESQEWYDLQISALYSRRGRWIGRIIVLRDITERKRTEQERERLIEELDAFAHTVAHDLKNPLTTISGYIQLLNSKRLSLPEESRSRHMHTIELSARKMYDIIEALLMLSEVRQQSDIPITPLDMGNIVTEALKRLEPKVKQKSAVITQPDTWQTTVGLDMWVEEIWVNYIGNAIKYGGEPPHIELGSQLQSDGTARFWVRDNGPGITPQDQAKLFIPFSRLEQRVAEGHGLGLSIVERIVNKLGGQVAVESVLGEGSTFSFTLPVGE